MNRKCSPNSRRSLFDSTGMANTRAGASLPVEYGGMRGCFPSCGDRQLFNGDKARIGWRAAGLPRLRCGMLTRWHVYAAAKTRFERCQTGLFQTAMPEKSRHSDVLAAGAKVNNGTWMSNCCLLFLFLLVCC